MRNLPGSHWKSTPVSQILCHNVVNALAENPHHQDLMTPKTASTSKDEAPPLWEYVPAAAFSLPSAAVSHIARNRLFVLRRLLRQENTANEASLKPEAKLRVLPEKQLARVAPAPAWDEAAAALHTALTEWLAQKEAPAPVVLLVRPPHSGQTGILTAWAEQQTKKVFQSPSPEQVLAGDEDWFPHPQDDEEPWVFAALERAYLRHASGISLVRRFLDRASSGALGRGIISCDSWAWAYLQRIWHGRLPATLTLQAFDKDRLSRCFHELANGSRRKPLRFFQTNNRHTVLPTEDPDTAPGEKSGFLHALAAHSRGNLGVAWAVWRASLRSEPDDVEVAAAASAEAPGSRLSTVWVQAWEELELPELPPGSGQDEAIVLHALLLHNGLPLDTVQQCLPLSPNQVMETLLRLEDAGLLAHRAPLWQVTDLGYPAARRFLQAGGYLVDAF